MFIVLYFAAIIGIIAFGIYRFCVNHPETAKLIAICTVVVAVTLGMIFFSMPAKADSCFYPRSAIVTELRPEEDLVVCQDAAKSYGSSTVSKISKLEILCRCFFGIAEHQIPSLTMRLSTLSTAVRCISWER